MTQSERAQGADAFDNQHFTLPTAFSAAATPPQERNAGRCPKGLIYSDGGGRRTWKLWVRQEQRVPEAGDELGGACVLPVAEAVREALEHVEDALLDVAQGGEGPPQEVPELPDVILQKKWRRR